MPVRTAPENSVYTGNHLLGGLRGARLRAQLEAEAAALLDAAHHAAWRGLFRLGDGDLPCVLADNHPVALRLLLLPRPGACSIHNWSMGKCCTSGRMKGLSSQQPSHVCCDRLVSSPCPQWNNQVLPSSTSEAKDMKKAATQDRGGYGTSNAKQDTL